jgi:hypothetical protein
VLQFPNAPLQEFTLEDRVDNDYGEGDGCGDSAFSDDNHDNDNDNDNGSGQQVPAGTGISSQPVLRFKSPECYVLRPIKSNGSFLDDNQHIPSPSDASTSTSPLPTKRTLFRKKIQLKPKRRFGSVRDCAACVDDNDTNHDHDDGPDDDESRGSTSSSSLEGNGGRRVRENEAAGAVLPILPSSFSFTSVGDSMTIMNADGSATATDTTTHQHRTLDQMTNDLNINDHTTATNANTNASTSNNSLPTASTSPTHGFIRRGGGSAFLSLRPKRLSRPSLSLKQKAPYADECGDMVMELDPNMSRSRDLGCSSWENTSTDTATATATNQPPSRHDEENFTPHHHRCPSVSFTDDCDMEPSPPRLGHVHAVRARSSSIQEQLEMAKEAAMRFGGIGHHTTSAGSIIYDGMMSPSLSESNFRTPNPESARKRHWFGGNYGQGHGTGTEPGVNRTCMQEEEKKGMVGLLLPKLFPSASEEADMQQAGPGQGSRGRSNSFFGMMKDAFSPPTSWKKSPV